jgi:hypothetical protein
MAFDCIVSVGSEGFLCKDLFFYFLRILESVTRCFFTPRSGSGIFYFRIRISELTRELSKFLGVKILSFFLFCCWIRNKHRGSAALKFRSKLHSSPVQGIPDLYYIAALLDPDPPWVTDPDPNTTIQEKFTPIRSYDQCCGSIRMHNFDVVPDPVCHFDAGPGSKPSFK